MPGVREKEIKKDRKYLYQEPTLVSLAEKAQVCGITLG